MTIMNTRQLLGCLVATAWLLVGTVDASAQGACVRNAPVADAKAALAQVEAFFDGDCLGGSKCDSEICRAVNPALVAATPTPDEVFAALRRIFAQAEAGQDTVAGRRLWLRTSLAIKEHTVDGVFPAAVWSLEDLTLFKDVLFGALDGNALYEIEQASQQLCDDLGERAYYANHNPLAAE